MTTNINRSRPFVDSKGTLTQYGWSVLQDLWRATGGAVSIDGNFLQLASLGPVPVESASTLFIQEGNLSPVTPPPGDAVAVGGDVGPVVVQHDHPAFDVGPI